MISNYEFSQEIFLWVVFTALTIGLCSFLWAEKQIIAAYKDGDSCGYRRGWDDADKAWADVLASNYVIKLSLKEIREQAFIAGYEKARSVYKKPVLASGSVKAGNTKRAPSGQNKPKSAPSKQKNANRSVKAVTTAKKPVNGAKAK